jgi:hypothetical protein
MKNDNFNLLDEIIYYAEAGVRKKGKHDTAYCGVRKVPKGKKMGTLSECIEKGEIRLWGREDYLKYRLVKVSKMLELFLEDMKGAHPGKEFQIMLKHKLRLESELRKIKEDLIKTKKHVDTNKKNIEEGLKKFSPKKK